MQPASPANCCPATTEMHRLMLPRGRRCKMDGSRCSQHAALQRQVEVPVAAAGRTAGWSLLGSQSQRQGWRGGVCDKRTEGEGQSNTDKQERARAGTRRRPSCCTGKLPARSTAAVQSCLCRTMTHLLLGCWAPAVPQVVQDRGCAAKHGI